jgi:2-oxoglutarate ferredoxin oxidoreductase subunit alpha|tara:strand:+ start:147 stop:1835 length:1689 start_codon:yes stop_codon:yes gene_type:complete
MSKNLVVRFAGEGGQGVVGGSELMASAAAESGYHVLTFATYPSQIKGGPAWGQARISSEPILTPGDSLDVLVCQNQYAYDANLPELSDDGIIVYNSQEFQIEHPRALALPTDDMAREAGNARAGTIVMIGAVAKAVGFSIEALESFITARWDRGRPGDAAIIEGNIKALHLGVTAADESGFEIAQVDPPVEEPESRERILIRGYEAACLGAMAAGLDVFIGYPISPATTMLTYMETNLNGDDKFVGQASSEIESIAALIGSGFAGKKTMTSTAGPGLSLMGEGLGLAWMSEIPLVVADVQRGGPATGLPTKTEQSDFIMAMNPGHGDMSLPVIAPGNVEEAFWATAKAVNWAERYQGPVILLTEMAVAERAQDIERPDTSLISQESRVISDGSVENRRYEGEGVSPFPVPGGPGAYVANGSEHDEQGDTTHLADVHIQMTERRFAKLKTLNDGTFEAENQSASVVIMPWGGSKGSGRGAWLELTSEGIDIGWYYTMYLNPLPEELLAELRTKEKVLVPELNYMGQFAGHLRQLGIKAETINQYTGLPWRVSDLKEEIKGRLS